MAGLEVEACEPVGAAVHRRGGRRSAVGRAPSERRQADRVQGRTPARKPLQVVCGAPNVRVGMKVPLAQVGASSRAWRSRSPLRGVESQACCARRASSVCPTITPACWCCRRRASRQRRARGARARRPRAHAQAHAQPRRLPVGARHRARGRRADRRAARSRPRSSRSPAKSKATASRCASPRPKAAGASPAA